MFECLGSCDAFGWVDGQHLIDEIFGFRSHCVPLRGRKLGGKDTRRRDETARRRSLNKNICNTKEAPPTKHKHRPMAELDRGRHVTYIISSSFDLLVETMLIFIPERGVTDQQDVENHT